MSIIVTSLQPCKVRAVHQVFAQAPDCVQTNSDVPNQPVGRNQIREGAVNRLSGVSQPTTGIVVSLETGIIDNASSYVDITCCLLWTRHGIFESWSAPHPIPSDAMSKWLELKDSSVTVGSIVSPGASNDWYLLNGGRTRTEVMAEAICAAHMQWQTSTNDMTAIPASLTKFKGVDFLDIQRPLIEQPAELMMAVRRLADRLLFDTVVVLDARGFLLCGEFAREGYPIVMARKPGKLPNEGPSVTYEKEYGSDTLCLSMDAIKTGSRVIIVDDLVATGGTLRAAEKLVMFAGGDVVTFIAPYAIETSHGSKLMAQGLGTKLRFLCTQREVQTGMPTFDIDYPVPSDRRLYIVPPSLRSMVVDKQILNVTWGRFARSSNVWFDAKSIEGKEVMVMVDPSNAQETMDVLQLMSILYRKDPSRARVIIPFLEQATQDRVEHTANGMESLAMMDTLGKLIGRHTVITFDLHAEQSQFSGYYDLRHVSIVHKLWTIFSNENPNVIPVFPDDGAAKRFGPLVDKWPCKPIVFRKRRNGATRTVVTDDAIGPGAYVIIDDLVRSGGTMYAVQKYLRAQSPCRVSALFAHAPLEPSASKNMCSFDEVWTSDSCHRSVPSEWVKIHVASML